MSDKKTIMINPELFSISAANTTRKKREPKEQKELKIREPSQKKQSTKTLKNKLLNYIRKTQEENYRKMHGHDPEIKPPTTSSRQSPVETFDNDFESSLKYLSEISEHASNSVTNHSLANATLKNYQAMNPESILNRMTTSSPTPPQNPLDIPFYNTLPAPPAESPSYRIQSPSSRPSWGCLKGGSLPTYRNWKNQTQRAVPQPNISILSPPKHENNPITPIINIPKNLGGNPPEKPLIDDIQRSIIHKTREKLDQPAIQVKKTELKYKKRKKTIRRTYKVGKSKTAPKIGVLISNKTVRNNISTKKQQLKQIPIEEIRRTLIKRGFIKVGSIAPNDVLRQMYESMVLVCGEVQNYNPDNLIYNFFNEKS
uniref:Uncharacterized protein n=1 Tax=viral metagenome TaxID=1070528 RepID=A0A6C0KK66_9ZZZZ